MKILFIGGTGNISTECAALLRGRGHEIQVLSRGRTPVPPEYRAVVADRKDPGAMRAALQGAKPDVVLNFLGYEVAEVQGDADLFQGAIRQYIFISSATVYEKPPRRLPITEDAPLGNAWWEYARKKLACEQWLLERRAQSGFPVTVVRPSHTYSKLWIPSPVSSSSYTFAARLEQGRPVFVPDDGENRWTMTAASDFAVGLGGLVGNERAIGECFQITSDEVLTWNQIVGEIAAAVREPSPGRPAVVPPQRILKIPTDLICEVAPELTGSLKGDKSHPGVFDNTKIKRFVPEFQCRKPFRVGIRESVAWLRAHPEQQNLSAEVESLMDRVVAAFEAGKR